MNTQSLPRKSASHRSPTTPADLGLAAVPANPRPQDPPAAHVRAKLDADLRELLAREPGTRSGTDPENLHQMRVAVRRMRSVLRLSGNLLGPVADDARAELGWLGRALGDVRDHDVLIGHLRELVADFEERDQPACRRLVSRFVTDRAVARRRLRRVLSSARYARLLQSLAQLGKPANHESEPVPVSSAPDAPTSGVDLVTELQRPYRKLGKAVDRLPDDPEDELLHELRVLGKRLRYAAELAQRAAKKKQAARVGKLVKAAKNLQTVLGEHQDAVVAAERVREMLDDLDGRMGFIAGRITERELVRRAQTRAEWPDLWTTVDTAARAVLA